MALRLRVVYAGRGDALVLEDGGRDELWLIDGGPLGWSAEGGGKAPYYGYLTEAVKKAAAALGQRRKSAILSGVVVSHAHEDHYGGIVELLTGPPKRRTVAVTVDGPFVTQPLDDPDQDGQEALERLLEKLDFVSQAGPAPEVLGPFAFGNPGTFERIVFEPEEAAALAAFEPLGKVWTVDTSVDNLKSVLMLHEPGRMVFTGDSVGARIEPFVAQVASNQPLWLFKVPHHGSLRNSQRIAAVASVPRPAQVEYALLCVMLDPREWNEWQVPRKLQESPGSMAVAKEVLEEVCGGAVYTKLEGELRRVVDANLLAAAAGGNFAWQSVSTPIGTFWRNFVVQMAARAIIGVSDGQSAARRKRGRDELLEGVSGSWTWALISPKVLSGPFLAELAFAELKAFYGSFSAYNYVISADGSHRHPAAETIAAIAAARSAAAPTARVFVTDASSIDLQRIANLAGPGWQQKIDLRALASGTEIALDLSSEANVVPPNPATPPPGTPCAIDPAGATKSVAAIAEPNRTQLHEQLQGGAHVKVPDRTVDRALYQVRIPGPTPTYLNLNRRGEPSVIGTPMSFQVEEAWAQQPPQPDPSTVRLVGSPGGKRLVRLESHGTRWALRLNPSGGAIEWVSTEAPSYRTTNPLDPNLALFEFAKVEAPEEDADRAGGAALATTEPTLRAFLEAAGLPTDAPLSGRAALVALVGPAAAAKVVTETKLPVLGRPFAWEADLDASTVTWSSDPEGLLVEAARVAVKVGANDTFTIEGTTETIVSAWLALERGDQLAATVGLKTEEGTELDHTATIAAPGRGRPLAEYLTEVGVAAAEWDEVVVAELLGRMLGSRSLVEDLLMNGPSFIAAAGLGIAKLDLEASEVETFVSPTGGLDVITARLVTEQAAIAAKVAGVALTLEGLVLTVGAPQVPEASVILTGAATITPPGAGAKPVPLAAEIALTEDRPELTLSLAAGATLSQVVALLPATPTLGNLEVPLVGGTLGAATLSSLGLSLRQPVEDANAYVVASVFGAVQFKNWGQVLPAGFPAVKEGRVELRVFDPEDAVRRRVGFEGEVTFELASKRALTASVGVWPMAGPGDTTAIEPGYSKTVTVVADPETGPVTLAEIVTAFGLPSTTAVPAPLTELLGSVALERLAIELADATAGGTEVAAFEIALAVAKEWSPLSGFSLTAGLLDLRYDGSEWSGEVAATMLLGEGVAIEAGYVVPTATTAGAFTFAPVGVLNLKEAADKVRFGTLDGVPLLGDLLETVSVTEVLLTLAAGTTKTPPITSYSLSLLLDTIEIGPLTVDGVGLDLTRTVPAVAGEEAQTLLWIEAELGGAAILEVAWDSAEGKLAGSLRMLETRTLNQMLAALFPKGTPTNVLLPLVGEVAVIGAELEFDTADAELKAFRLELDTSKVLKLGTASITTLGIEYEAGATPAEPKTYALTGKLRGPNAGADIKVRCQVEAGATTVAAVVKSVGPGPEALTLKGLVSLLLPGNPTVPPLADAPDFLSLEVGEVSAKLSYSTSELGLEALKAKVQSTAAITLLATAPPLVLKELWLEVAYEKKASQAVTGTIFGMLTVPSTPAVTLALEYSLDGQGVGVFAGDLSVSGAQPVFAKLLESGPFDPGDGGGVPAGIGLPAIPMAELSVRVEVPPSPKPTSVAVSGYARPTEWKRETLGVAFAVKELGGSVKVTAPVSAGGEFDYACSLFGALSFGGFVGRATLAFGAREDTVLTAVTTEAKAVSLPEVAGMLSGGGEAAWTEVVPTGTAPLGFGQGTTGYAYLNFTHESFALLGSLAGFGVGALVSHPGPAGTRGFAFLAALSGSPSKPFRFANLWTELEPVDRYLAVRVANLALIDYSGGVAELEADIAAVERAAAAEGVALEAPFKGLDWLGEPGVGPTQLTKGGAFFADLALSPEATLSHNLESMVDEPGAAAAIALYALVDHAEPKNTVYAGTIADLKLLGGGLVLAGALSYRPSAAVTQLEAAGSLTLKLEAAEAGYKFEGKLTLGTDKATFAASTTGVAIKIEDPFGMFGIAIANARLTAEFDFGAPGTTSTIAVGGDVEFKVVIALKLTASIVFVSGSPVLAKVELPGALSFDELLRGIGLPWPTGYELLTLEGGSMYYAPAAVTIGGVPYEEGYHLATTAKVLGQAIGIGVEVASDGVVAQAVVVAGFDFGFLQLTGYEESGHVYKGPFVRLSTRGTASFTIGAGVSLFRTPLASTTVTYKPALSEWLGSVTVPALEDTTVEFTWSEADGFRLTNMELVSQVIEWAELAEQLISASSASECGAAVGLAWETLVETKVHAKLAQAGAVSAQGLPFAIEGTFDLIVADATIVSVPLPKLEGVVPAPDSFELSALPGWLLKLLDANLAKMAASLWEHKEDLARLIAVLAGVTAAREGLVALICNDIETPNVGEDVVESVESGVTEAAEGAGEVAADAAAALEAGGMAEAAGSTIAAATAFVALGLLIGEVVHLIDEATPWLGEEVSGKKKALEAEGEKGKGELARAEARMQELLTMAGAPTAAFAAVTRVAVAWTDADRPTRAEFDYEGYAGFAYLAQVSTTADFSSGVVSAEVPGATSPIEVELPALAAVNNAYARIRAVYTHGVKEWKGPWREAAAPAFHTVPLAAPASVTQALAADGDTIAVTVAPVANATAYTVTLVDPTKPTVVLLHQQVPAPASGPAVASLDTRLLPDTVATGASLVAVGVAEGDPTIHSPSPPTDSAPLPTSAPLSVPTVAVEADGLHVTWAAAQTAPRPQLRVEVGGALLSPQPAVLAWDADGKGCLLGVEGITAGQTAGVEMRLPDPAHVALWSSPPATVAVPMVAPPGHLAAIFDCAASALVLSWDEDTASTGWAVECRAAGGGALTPAPTITAGPTGATAGGPAIAAGHSYEARARGLRAGSVSVWSGWAEVSATAVGAVGGVAFAFSGTGLTVSWDAYPAADLYRVQLLALPARTVAAEASPAAVEADFPLKAPLAPETECEASVRALVSSSLGLAGTAKLTTPSLLALIEAGRAGSLAAAQAAAAALAYKPALGYAELLVTLIAAGYPTAEAEAATLADFPGANLAPLVAALHTPALLAPLLAAAPASVAAAVIVRLAAKLFAGKAVELAIQLRLGGLGQAAVAAALPSAYPGLTPASAAAIAAAAYVEPWALGAQLSAGPVAETAVVPDLLDAYPTLPALRAMASLNGSYKIGDREAPVGEALVARYPDDWGEALGALLDRQGKAAARKLQGESVPREEATSYVVAAFPWLSAEEVKEAIEAAYGPSG